MPALLMLDRLVLERKRMCRSNLIRPGDFLVDAVSGYYVTTFMTHQPLRPQ